MKKVLSVFLALAMLLPVLPLDTIPVSALQSGDYIYTISGNPSRASITGYTGAGGNITIPLQLDIYPVAFIGYKAFYNCTSLTSVNILDNILEVDEYAFYYCTELKSVTFGSNVGKIDNYAFYNCSNLTSITIPNSVTGISGNSFWECNGLVSVNIGSGLSFMSPSAFFYCVSLTQINVAGGNLTFSSKDGVLFNKAQTLLIQYPEGISGAYAIPNGVTSIGSGAFDYCTKLTSVTIPASLSSVLEGQFIGCSSLTEIIANEDNTSFSSQDGVLFNETKTLLIQYPGGKAEDYVIPNSVTNIGGYAFADCSILQSVTIGNSVTDIGYRAFYWCSNLNELVIPNVVLTIGNGAFGYCSNLTNVTIPNSVTGISGNAFYKCTKLKSVTIGFNVAAIGSWAFYGCSALTAAYFLGNAPTLDSDVFKQCATTFKVYYIDGKTKFTNPWYGYTTAIYTNASLGVKNGSTTFINENNQFAYGLSPGLAKSEFENNYVQINGNGRIVYTPDSNSLGTGTKVELIDNITGEIIKTYTIIIFGDLNGDGNIDSMDAGIAVDIENGLTDWTPADNAPQYFAGNINSDGNVDSQDAGLIVDFENNLMNINQVTGRASDS